MAEYIEPLEIIIEQFRKLPGVGNDHLQDLFVIALHILYNVPLGNIVKAAGRICLCLQIIFQNGNRIIIVFGQIYRFLIKIFIINRFIAQAL